MKIKALSLAILAATLPMASFSATQVSPAEKARIEQVVHDYLLSNPEVIIEAVQTLQKKQMDQMKQSVQKTQDVAVKFANSLFHQPNDLVAGNPNGKVTLVEFLDFQCGHCIEMSGLVDNLIKDNSDLRVVYKQFPIRGAASVTAAKAVIASNQQGKFVAFQNALMAAVKKNPQPLTEETIFQTAKSVGLNVDQLKKDMNDAKTEDAIKANTKLAQDLKLFGTPAFFIGKTNLANDAAVGSITYIPGGMEQKQLQGLVDKNKA